ncbi:hypothetical protein [Pantoea agglomerans]|nr:hypothetical protein [Pantoea agglomerans]
MISHADIILLQQAEILLVIGGSDRPELSLNIIDRYLVASET